MSLIECAEELEQGAGESILHAVDFSPWLAKDASGRVTQLLSGTPTVVDQASVLTLSSKAVSTSDVVLLPSLDVVPAGQAVQFRASGGVAGTLYRITVTVGDTGGNTWVCVVRLRIVGVA